MKIDTEHFKKKLEEELEFITSELKTVGRINPNNPADWEAKPPEMDILQADRNEAADRIEGYEENSAILKELEIRFNNIKDAIKRIEDGAYGVCEVGKEEIKIERLEANPAAKTCVKHMNKEE